MPLVGKKYIRYQVSLGALPKTLGFNVVFEYFFIHNENEIHFHYNHNPHSVKLFLLQDFSLRISQKVPQGMLVILSEREESRFFNTF
jgi:hypothetical protein